MRLLHFDTYEHYLETQTEANKQKLDHVWVTAKELRTISRYINKTMPGSRSATC